MSSASCSGSILWVLLSNLLSTCVVYLCRHYRCNCSGRVFLRLDISSSFAATILACRCALHLRVASKRVRCSRGKWLSPSCYCCSMMMIGSRDLVVSKLISAQKLIRIENNFAARVIIKIIIMKPRDLCCLSPPSSSSWNNGSKVATATFLSIILLSSTLHDHRCSAHLHADRGDLQRLLVWCTVQRRGDAFTVKTRTPTICQNCRSKT